MTLEAGSSQCRGLIEAKEYILRAMNSLESIENLEIIKKNLLDTFNQLEKAHEERREKEKGSN